MRIFSGENHRGENHRGENHQWKRTSTVKIQPLAEPSEVLESEQRKLFKFKTLFLSSLLIEQLHCLRHFISQTKRKFLNYKFWLVISVKWFHFSLVSLQQAAQVDRLNFILDLIWQIVAGRKSENKSLWACVVLCGLWRDFVKFLRYQKLFTS